MAFLLDKVYIWAFPGIGKSAAADNKRVVDADCERFKYVFPDSVPDNLHRRGEWGPIGRDQSYPENYFKYVDSVNAEVVLINCHISLLDHFDKERLILVYPSEHLKDEYLQRYAKRGDNDSFLEYMRDTFEDMVSAIRSYPCRTIELTKPNVYLKDLLNGGNLMSQFMTKSELTEFFRESVELGTIQLPSICAGKSPEQLSQMLFEGEFNIDLDIAKNDLEQKKKFIEKDRKWTERRGGLSRDELADKIMQGIVNGAINIRYAEIAPYSRGYEVVFSGENPDTKDVSTNRWECYSCKSLFDVPYRVADFIAENKQHNAFMGVKCDPLDIHKMLQSIEDMEAKKITSFTPAKDTDLVHASDPTRYPFRSSVATVKDVHAGKGLDGIVQHHYHGTYSTMTPTRQNSLVEALVCLKGFCLDNLKSLGVTPDEKASIVQYLKAHGTDISTPEKLQAWIDANPDKCALAENRAKEQSLIGRIQSATARANESQAKSETPNKDRDTGR